MFRLLTGSIVALRRLEQGAYGNCSDCNDPIPEARLAALPFAVRCRQCEAARELTTMSERRFSAIAGRNWSAL